MPRWKQGAPTAEGIYLRSNPPISHIVRQDVFLGLGNVLKISNPEDGFDGIPVAELSDRFWWFGPIPEPDWKSQPT